jgi:dTDP-4-dehydrorhamnose 3,5-epimerase
MIWPGLFFDFQTRPGRRDSTNETGVACRMRWYLQSSPVAAAGDRRHAQRERGRRFSHAGQDAKRLRLLRALRQGRAMSPLLEVRPLAIGDVLELVPKRFGDDRGYFCEIYNKQRFGEETGAAIQFVQTNQSLSADKATLRGLHFQAPPFAQIKLVWVVRGAVFDVAVDIRLTSPTYGRWASVLLSAEKGNQILVPAGFAHGFLTLEPDTIVQYQVDNHYAPAHDRGIRWDDPEIAIDWPLAGATPTLSKRDAAFPSLSEIETPFGLAGEG